MQKFSAFQSYTEYALTYSYSGQVGRPLDIYITHVRSTDLRHRSIVLRCWTIASLRHRGDQSSTARWIHGGANGLNLTTALRCR